MDSTRSTRWRYVALILVLALLVGCAAPGTAPTGGIAKDADPTMTAKPTFTLSADKVAQQSTAAPTLAPTKAAPTDAPTAGATAPAVTDNPGPTAVPPTETPIPPTAIPAKSLRMNSPEYGMQTFMWWRPEVGSRDLQVIHDAGFGWVKTNFGWRDIEGAGRGIFDWSHTDPIVDMANQEGVDLLVRIDHQPSWAGGGFPLNGPPDNMQDFANFLTALVSRYQGRIRAYEVWNEPNLAREWGGKPPDPGAYVKMLRVAYQAIKAADPNAMIISAGLSPTGTWNDEAKPDDWYLESMYVAMNGSGDDYFDVLGAHAPGYLSPPERDPAEVAANPAYGGSRAFCFRRVEDLRAIMVKYGDQARQVAVLEFGWTSDPRADSPYHWHAVSEDVKADYFVRAYRYAQQNWAPWIGLMSLIYICDPDWTQNDEQYWWAISDPGWPEFHPRPAYDALKAMPKS